MARNRTANSTSKKFWLSASAAAAAAGGLVWVFLRPKKAYAPTLQNALPPDPPHDRFGNTGEENIVEPMSLKEDQNFMSDKLNPRNGLI